MAALAPVLAQGPSGLQAYKSVASSSFIGNTRGRRLWFALPSAESRGRLYG